MITGKGIIIIIPFADIHNVTASFCMDYGEYIPYNMVYDSMANKCNSHNQFIPHLVIYVNIKLHL